MLQSILTIFSGFSNLFGPLDQAKGAASRTQSKSNLALEKRILELERELKIVKTTTAPQTKPVTDEQTLAMLKSLESQVISLYDEKARSGISDLMEAADTIRALEEQVEILQAQSSQSDYSVSQEQQVVEEQSSGTPSSVLELQEMVSNLESQVAELIRDREIYGDEHAKIASMEEQLCSLYSEKAEQQKSVQPMSQTQQHVEELPMVNDAPEAASISTAASSPAATNSSATSAEISKLRNQVMELQSQVSELKGKLKKIASLALQSGILED